MELNPTSYVVLGSLSFGPRSGYDIKQLADISTRHFWAISYGQIYPELRRLSASGLVSAEDASRGTRHRTVYHLTDRGRQMLNEWVSEPALTKVEIRDEMLLKLFFADAVPRKDTVRLLEVMRRRHREIAAGLRENEPMAAAQQHEMKYEVMRFGIALHEWCADWYGKLAADLERGRGAR